MLGCASAALVETDQAQLLMVHGLRTLNAPGPDERWKPSEPAKVGLESALRAGPIGAAYDILQHQHRLLIEPRARSEADDGEDYGHYNSGSDDDRPTPLRSIRVAKELHLELGHIVPAAPFKIAQ